MITPEYLQELFRELYPDPTIKLIQHEDGNWFIAYFDEGEDHRGNVISNVMVESMRIGVDIIAAWLYLSELKSKRKWAGVDPLDIPF